MKKYYDMKEYQADLAKTDVALCHRFRNDMSEEIIIDDADEVLMEVIHEEYLRDYDIKMVCEALKVSPDVIVGAQGVTDMITSCYCTHNKNDGKLTDGELVIQVGPKAKISLQYFDEMLRVYTSGSIMTLTKELRDEILSSSETLSNFIDLIMLMEVKTGKLLEMNANGKNETRSYKKLKEELDKLKENFNDRNYKLDPKTAKAAAGDIADCYSLAFTRALDKTLVEERMIPKHGKLPDKKLGGYINRQMREKIDDNVYDREVNNILH